MLEERTGEAFEAGEKLTVVGRRLRVGEPAPAFTLDAMSPDDGSIQQVSLAGLRERVLLLNVVNSIDTSVCQAETRSWERRLPAEEDVARVYTVSMDLPFAQDRWRRAESIQHRLLSAHRSETFGEAYGTLIKEWRMLQRAVFVIDKAGTLAHVEYVADQLLEPDYEAALSCVARLQP